MVFRPSLVLMLVATAMAAPQFNLGDQQPATSYDFGYGVNVPESGDVKEHKQSLSPSGRTDGESRWLQPNGLFRVVRYTVEGGLGFQAIVTEEAGNEVANYNNFDGSDNSARAQTFSGSANNQRVFGNKQTFGSQSFNGPKTFQSRAQRQVFKSPQTFLTQPVPQFGNVIDGGVIDGGIIDGGIIDGGIIGSTIISSSNSVVSPFSSGANSFISGSTDFVGSGILSTQSNSLNSRSGDLSFGSSIFNSGSSNFNAGSTNINSQSNRFTSGSGVNSSGPNSLAVILASDTSRLNG
ncbi:putative lingerer-like [Homarus americanus]|uniref:Putative lingerer-like n=1 Tax=Homarus americanus TaxID=6706 RepID=A0A8J5MWG3_HOMAM|nr:putative lingerer-like [Homarus americanus]